MVEKIYLVVDGEEICLTVEPSGQISAVSFDGIPLDMEELRATARRELTLRN